MVSHARRHRDPETFEEWVTGRFGKRLYAKFFGPYTAKVWGVPGSEIRAEWAAQRIQNFSLAVAMLSILGLHRRSVTTLIEEFHYPRLGPGQMWEAFADWTTERDFPVHLEHPCVSIRHAGGRVTSIVTESPAGRREIAVDGLVSTMPLRELLLRLDPLPPAEVCEAARRLRYRHLCVVALMIKGDQPFPDNWIYLHDPDVRAGRVQNFGAWSESMVPHGTCLGVEYFCDEDDDVWSLSEEEAVELATTELARIGLVDPDLVIDGAKIPAVNAYPMYLEGYEAAVASIRGYLDGFENLQTAGRNGLHRYNNQDHSMVTGAYAAMNLLHGESHDVWSVNADAVYLEEGSPLTGLIDGIDLDPSAEPVAYTKPAADPKPVA
jgi:protoporphyrinogen oxidase